jgi:4-alpha-glucanotransferase
VQRVEFEQARDYADALWKAAAECGIEREYWDVLVKRHEASPEVVRGILEALGWNAATFETLEQARAARFEKRIAEILPKTAVISESEKSVPITLPASDSGSICFQILLEDGHRLAGSIEAGQLRASRGTAMPGREWVTYELNLPAEVPLGYHALELTVDGTAVGECHLIVCPDRAYVPDWLGNGGRTAGFNVALYGLRSGRNWGCGDFTDLRNLCDWGRRQIGFSFIGLNPLHALHNRTPYNTSPYLPLSVFYRNLIYLDIEAVPEFKSSRCAQGLRHSAPVETAIHKLREAEFVAYEDVDRLKRRFLKLLYREFRKGTQERRAAFAEYCAREGELLNKFALYCALDEGLHKRDRDLWTWRDWPEEYRDPGSEACRRFGAEHPRAVELYKYVQFAIDEQLAAAQQHGRQCGMEIGLYHDLAVATDSCGADLWAHRSYYVNGCRVGAPPDEFSPNGQDWCFPPPDCEAHRESGYRLYRESIRKICAHGGALRIDHVMRLVRLFWIPEGATPAQGTYVRDYAVELLRILALESVRNKTVIIGEDLGTVTDEIRELLARFCILSYRLFYFEKNSQDGSFKGSFEYPRQALVASSTHDLATFVGFWNGCDIEARKAAGLIDENAYAAQVHGRSREKQRMLDRLHAENLLPQDYPRDAAQVPAVDGHLHNAMIGFLAQTPSMILLLNQEDLTMESCQQNLPGSTAQYPNWQRKMKSKVEDLLSSAWQGYANMFRDQLARTGRRVK